MSKYNFSPEELGYIGTWTGILSLLGNGLLSGPLVGRYGERTVIIFSAVLIAAAYVLLPALGGAGYALVALPVRSVAGLAGALAHKSLLTQATPTDAIGSTLAAQDLISSACGVIAPTVAGVLLELVGTELYPYTGAFFYLLSAIVSYFLIQWQDQKIKNN